MKTIIFSTAIERRKTLSKKLSNSKIRDATAAAQVYSRTESVCFTVTLYSFDKDNQQNTFFLSQNTWAICYFGKDCILILFAGGEDRRYQIIKPLIYFGFIQIHPNFIIRKIQKIFTWFSSSKPLPTGSSIDWLAGIFSVFFLLCTPPHPLSFLQTPQNTGACCPSVI